MAMGHRNKMLGGDEYDAFTGWRKVLNRPYGGWKKTKQRFNKRVRREVKENLKKGIDRKTSEPL